MGVVVILGIGLLMLLGIIGSNIKPTNSASAVRDDADLIISSCGRPDTDDSTAYDDPRPALPTRLLEYKEHNIRFSFIPGENITASDAPPYHWKILGVQDTVTNEPVDTTTATQRMPCWNSH